MLIWLTIKYKNYFYATSNKITRPLPHEIKIRKRKWSLWEIANLMDQMEGESLLLIILIQWSFNVMKKCTKWVKKKKKKKISTFAET